MPKARAARLHRDKKPVWTFSKLEIFFGGEKAFCRSGCCWGLPVEWHGAGNAMRRTERGFHAAMLGSGCRMAPSARGSRLCGGKESDAPAGSLLPPREENVVALSRIVPRNELGPHLGEHRSAGKVTGLITWWKKPMCALDWGRCANQGPREEAPCLHR